METETRIVNGTPLKGQECFSWTADDGITVYLFMAAHNGHNWHVSRMTPGRGMSWELTALDVWHDLPDAVQGARADYAENIATTPYPGPWNDGR